MTKSPSFVVYRLPQQTELYYNSSKARIIEKICDLKESHFIMTPFDEESACPIFAFNSKHTKRINSEEWIDLALDFKSKPFETHHASAKEHQKQVHQIIEEIEKGELKKVVLSRVQAFKRNDKSIKQVFTQLCDKYPNAFVYLTQLPNGQIWCGASPETLAKFEESKFETMALAGTKVIDKENAEDLVWPVKEQDEQIWVQNYIRSLFKSHMLNFTQSEPYSAIAGPVAHIRSDFSAMAAATIATQLLLQLHPTPAVCGTPTQKAKDFLLQIEKHDRIYYTGFIGIYAPQKFHLFVNLRCMQIDDEAFHLYLGGGITKDSIAEDEYQETENKAQTLSAFL
ncbi:isochorismate synthase [Lentimicrobium sp. L6]|uniref:isochorismate synthase n=1 Tax=Lentimicrobium sp. L6 TaxID=2735916 RepID=UPI00155319DC|nr:isochorismate synthase [Lentimicrobium sp. L6]NPD85685.1 isochorismate synthase [Lentimicrobium sp. L6]